MVNGPDSSPSLGQPGPGGRMLGWLSRSRMALSQPWTAVVPRLMGPHRWPSALRLAQGVIRRWTTPMTRMQHWGRLSGSVYGIGPELEYIYRTRLWRPLHRPRRAPFFAPAEAKAAPGLAFASFVSSVPARWPSEEEAPPTAEIGPTEAPSQIEPAPIAAHSPVPPEEGRLAPAPVEPEARTFTPPPQGVPGTAQRLAQPAWPERRLGQPGAVVLGLAAQVLARWASAHVTRSVPLAKAPPMAVRRLHRLGEPAPTALSREVLSHHGVAPQPTVAPPSLLRGDERLAIVLGRGLKKVEDGGRKSIRPSSVRHPSSGKIQPGLSALSRLLPRLSHRVTDRPIVLSRPGIPSGLEPLRGEAPSASERRAMGEGGIRPSMRRLTALAEDVLIRHGVLPPVPAQRQPFKPPGMIPRWPRRVPGQPLAGGQIAAIGAEPLRGAPPYEIAAPSGEVGPALQAPQTTDEGRRTMGYLSAGEAQPVAGRATLAPEAQALPQQKPVLFEKAGFYPAQPPRPPHRSSGLVAPHVEAQPSQERPAHQGQWATSLSRQVLSRHAITVLALTRPGLILRLRRHALSTEAAPLPHRLAAWPEDILVRYSLFPEPIQLPILESGWIQLPGVAPGIGEGQSEARRRAPEVVYRLPRWLPHGAGRLAAEALERTSDLTTGEQAVFPARPGEGRRPRPAFSLPSFSIREREREEEIVVHRLPSVRQRAIPPKAGVGQRSPAPGSAIMPEVLARAAGWLASRAGTTLAFLEALWPTREPPAGIKETEEPAQAQREWPALSLLRRLARPAMSGEPAALQVLRRLSPAQRRPVLEALQSLPALGPGEALPPSVRQPMETLLGRDLSTVRLYIAPAAAALGAEAFTSGERIVFAPGRLDVRSRQGLALIGHELTHIGQPLAFKQSPSAGLAVVDREEKEAQRQEAIIWRLAEEGWPTGPRMEVRRTLPAPAPAAVGQVTDLEAAAERKAASGPTGLRFERVTVQPPAQPMIQRARADGRGPVGPFSESATVPTAVGADQPGAPDLDALAQQVYSLLKARLRAERDRHQLYPR